MTAPHAPMQSVRDAAWVRSRQRRSDTSPARPDEPAGAPALPGRRRAVAVHRPKVVEWYVWDAANRHELDEGTANAALSLLMERLPAADADAARERILATLRETYRK